MAIGNPITLTDNVASKIVSTTATADQTLFTVSGGYRVNQIAVFRNGIRLVTGNDFIARDGSTVTLTTAANDGDSIEFQIFDDFRVSDAIVATASTQTLSGDLSATGTIYGAAIGIQSGGTHIGIAQTLNFVGSGNTFSVTGQTIDVSISGGGGGGGGLGTAINFSDESTASPFSYIDAQATVTEDMFLGTSKAGGNNSYIVTVVPNIEISSGAAVTVGTGKTMIIDVLQIGDL
jgi:hypothetical protein|tara:strand:+ start:155 stop:856 length:702 start_codon:yes stop_codon:yes gene_type:complete